MIIYQSPLSCVSNLLYLISSIQSPLSGNIFRKGKLLSGKSDETK